MGWTVFTTACWRKKAINTQRTIAVTKQCRSRTWLTAAIVLLFLTGNSSQAAGIENVERAINNGVELTFICEFATIKQFLFVKWPDQLKSHHFLVKHHALSNSYLVSDETDRAPKIFRSTTDSMSYIASEALKLFARYQSGESPYQMRLQLSKYDLPAPMRLNAFVANDWDLNTGWKKWQSAR